MKTICMEIILITFGLIATGCSSKQAKQPDAKQVNQEYQKTMDAMRQMTSGTTATLNGTAKPANQPSSAKKQSPSSNPPAKK
ncbi:MAG: hypothetical protein ACYCOR_18800 [Acidobacteriaceae bacterium]